MFTAKLGFGSNYETCGALTEVRRKEGDRVVDEIPLNSKAGELFKDQLGKLKEFMDVSFIADIEFKNIRIAKYLSIDVEESKNDK